jgi:hypothetical protein
MPDTELESLSRLIADAAEPLPAIDVRQAARFVSGLPCGAVSLWRWCAAWRSSSHW